MNKREAEYYAYAGGFDKETLDELERIYQAALQDINQKVKLLQSDDATASQIYHLQYQKVLKWQVEAILEKLHSEAYETIQAYIDDCYLDGFVGVVYSLHGQGFPLLLPINQREAAKAVVSNSKVSEGLYKSLGADLDKLKKTISAEISRGIASGKSYAEIARNISNQANIPYKRARTITLTEAHRIREEATQDARIKAKENGCNIVKQWDATLDGKTRPTHRRLDGQIREVDEPFEIDGKKAMQPVGFGLPEEDINCRCVSLTRAKWALNEKELETLKKRAEFFRLDKTKDFEEFKRKYLDALKK